MAGMSYVVPMAILPSTQPPSEASPSYICPLIGDLDMRGSPPPNKSVKYCINVKA